jgi:DNA-binding NarL/FixJ family response regulator
MTTRVGIVATAELVRAGLQRLVEAHPRFEIVAAAATIPQLRAVLAERSAARLDVAIVDWPISATNNDGYEDLAPLWSLLESGTRLVLLTDGEPDVILPLVAAGAAWLPAAARDDEIAAAIDAVAAGLVALRSDSISDLLHQPPGWRERHALEHIEPLTPREREVLRLLAEGLGNRRIAERLGISQHTAKFHVGSILGKLDAATRAEAVAIALRDRLIGV